MKKILTILFIFLFTNISFAQFTDVNWDTLYKDGVNLLKENNIVKGYSDGSFGIGKNISRSEMLKILVESKFLIENTNTELLDEYQNQNCFQDVSSNQWFAKYVCWAKENQWINGYNNGTEFRPNNQVTLVEALKMMLKSGDLDYEETQRWYKGVVDKASIHNLIPFDADYFHNNLKRDQMADMIARLINFKQDSLNEYLKDRKDLVVSWDTLKVRQNLLNDYPNDCMTPFYNRMIHQTLFNFYDQNESCISISSIYNNSLDELPSQDFDHEFFKEYSYFSVFYKTNIENQELVEEILNSLTFYDDDKENFDKNAKNADYHSQNGVYYVNFPSNFKKFNSIEYPIYTQEDSDEKLSFEEQKSKWRIEAEDRFDLESCDEYNFPSFMMFKIKSFYDYCQELRLESKNNTSEPSVTENALTQIETFEETYCESKPEIKEDGMLKFPIQDEYLNLGPLGEIFTAYKCSDTQRLNELSFVEEYTYQKPIEVQLNENPDPELIDLFQVLGFQCKDNLKAEECTLFETKEEKISVDSLNQLETYFEKFKSAK